MTTKFSRTDTVVIYGAPANPYDKIPPKKEWPKAEPPIYYPMYAAPMEPLVIPSVPCEPVVPPTEPPTTTQEAVNNIVEIAKKRISELQNQKQSHQNEINILEEEIDTLQKIIDATE